MEKELEIQAVIGFKGSSCFSSFPYLLFLILGNVFQGLLLHPDNEHLLFPLGSTIIVRHIISRTQAFLRGHDNQISILTVSSSGKYVASGQKTYMGFQVILNIIFLNLNQYP